MVVAGGGGALLTVRCTAGPSPWDRRGGTAGAGDGDGEGDGEGDGRAPGAGDGWLTDPSTAGDGDVAPTMGTMPTRKGVPRGVMATGSTPPWARGDAWAVEPYAAGEWDCSLPVSPCVEAPADPTVTPLAPLDARTLMVRYG